jgi:hypothetical protein
MKRFFELYLIRPVIVACDVLIRSFYKLCFSWWLDGWMSGGLQRRLANDIRVDFSWLFEKYGAQIVPTGKYRQVLDYAVVTVQVEDLLFKFTRGHDEFIISVAPEHAPHDLYPFQEALDLSGAGTFRNVSNATVVRDFRELFEANFGHLRTFFSKEKYGPPRQGRSVKKLTRLSKY